MYLSHVVLSSLVLHVHHISNASRVAFHLKRAVASNYLPTSCLHTERIKEVATRLSVPTLGVQSYKVLVIHVKFMYIAIHAQTLISLRSAGIRSTS